ncbi:MAG: hypothetical protein HKP21_03350 [Xanthomonadales bacterium]|nr:hypothetical protein [Gammaproteobacteria bacterium]MBT8072724.1 hypothetical protein [Gammaproteobacteria bacterium]NNK03566.1 hypothetical protein [Xanthomonadales bacterium]NNK99507.1 hypothetical protein [Xanthomonadales bacterium]
MKKYTLLLTLALATLTCAVLEGLVELSPRFIQFNGGLTIICAVVVIGWILRHQVSIFSKD